VEPLTKNRLDERAALVNSILELVVSKAALAASSAGAGCLYGVWLGSVLAALGQIDSRHYVGPDQGLDWQHEFS
jgi:hypothetical protein